MSVIDVTPVVKENFKLILTDFFFEKLIADHDLDGFIVATSPLYQPKIISHMIKMKIPIIAEKPICLKYSELDFIETLF